MDSWIITGVTYSQDAVWCELFAPDRTTAMKLARWTYPEIHWQKTWCTLTRHQAGQKYGREYVMERKHD